LQYAAHVIAKCNLTDHQENH